MGNVLINPNAAGKNFGQFGSMSAANTSQAGSSFSGGVGGFGLFGAMLGAGLNLIGADIQNQQTEAWYNMYQSPQALMRQMVNAGINPNTAAAGIAGTGSTQMNVANTSGLGQAAAQGAEAGTSMYNARTQSRLADAQVQAAEAQARSMQMDTALKEVELGFKPSLLAAEESNKRAQTLETLQNVSQSLKEIERIDAEIDKLKEEKDLIIAQQGEVEYRKRLEEAETRRENAVAEQTREMTKIMNNDLSNRYNAAVAKGDYDEAQKILQDMYNKENTSAQASFDANPINKDFNTQYKAMTTLDAQRNQAIEAQKQLSIKFYKGETNLSDEEYYALDGQLSQLIKECDTQKKSVERAFNKRSYQTGYHTEWQDKSVQLIDIGGKLINTVAGALILSSGMGKAGAAAGGKTYQTAPASTITQNPYTYIQH